MDDLRRHRVDGARPRAASTHRCADARSRRRGGYPRARDRSNLSRRTRLRAARRPHLQYLAADRRGPGAGRRAPLLLFAALAQFVREHAHGAVRPPHGGLCAGAARSAARRRCRARAEGRGRAYGRARAGVGRHPAGRARHCDAHSPGAARAGAAAPGHGHGSARHCRRARGAPRAAPRARRRGRERHRLAARGARDVIEVTEQDGVAVVRLAHGKVNAMSMEFCEALTARFAEIPPARAVVMTATGRTFSAGVDLVRLLEGGAPYLRKFLPVLSNMFATVFSHPAPVVAAINGHAIAGGCVLACAADKRLMARDGGRIGVTELLVGVPFPPAAMEIMRCAAAPQLFADVILTGATYTPAEAVARGFVHDVVEPQALLESAVAAANALASLPPKAFALTKRQIRAPTLEHAKPQARRRHRANLDRARDARARSRLRGAHAAQIVNGPCCKLGPAMPGHAAAKPCSRSAMMSTLSSSPIERRTTSGPAPAWIFCASVSWRCVVEAG